jgi:hypothetical protein
VNGQAGSGQQRQGKPDPRIARQRSQNRHKGPILWCIEYCTFRSRRRPVVARNAIF